MDDGSYDFSLKIAVMGDTGVGKTSLVRMQTMGGSSASDARPSGLIYSNTAVSTSKTSVGVNLQIQSYLHDGLTYRVQFWDAPGTEGSRLQSTRLCAGAAGCLLVFDTTRKATFNNVQAWYEAMMQAAPQATQIKMVLVGNKCDLDGRAVPRALAEAYANKMGMEYFETSAEDDANVKEAFSTLLNLITSDIPNPPEPSLLLARGIKIGRFIEASLPTKQRLAFDSSQVSSTVSWL